MQEIKHTDIAFNKVVMDFDGTLSYGRRKDGKRNSSIATLRDGGYLPPEYDARAHALHDHYHAIEVDHTLPHEYRAQMMDEWWCRHSDLMIEYGLTSEIMERAGRSHYVQLRSGLIELFNFFKERNIEAYVYTAGRKDLVYYTLLEAGAHIDENHVIGNYFIYDESGKAINYNRPQITSFNKKEKGTFNLLVQHSLPEEEFSSQGISLV